MRKLFYSIILTMIGVIIFIPKVYASSTYYIPFTYVVEGILTDENIAVYSINYDLDTYTSSDFYDLYVFMLEENISRVHISLDSNYEYKLYNNGVYTDLTNATDLIFRYDWETQEYIFEYVYNNLGNYGSSILFHDVLDPHLVGYSIMAFNTNYQETDYILGYLKGKEEGKAEGLLEGILEGREEYGYYENGIWYTAYDYAVNRFDGGILEGREEYGYYENGVWYTAEQHGVNEYNKGYSKAIENSGDLKLAIKDFVPGILGSIFMFFFTLSSMSILGISILEVLVLVFGVGAIIFVIKLIF